MDVAADSRSRTNPKAGDDRVQLLERHVLELIHDDEVRVVGHAAQEAGAFEHQLALLFQDLVRVAAPGQGREYPS